MKKKALYVWLLCILFCGNNCQQNKELNSNSPNILIILADDLDYSDLGIYGSEIPTPNIDQLTKEGIQFTNFFTSPEDSQTRAMLLTGTSQGRSEKSNQLNSQVITIAELLKDAGYRTYMSGKWNLGVASPNLPIDKGFEKSFALLAEACTHLGNKRYLPALFRENKNIVEISEDFYSTQYFSRKMLGFLASGKKRKKKRKPFFAYLSFTAPHYPLQASTSVIENFNSQYDEGYTAIYQKRIVNQQEMGLYLHHNTSINLPNWDKLSPDLKAYESRKMAIYAAMVNELDSHIGKIIDYLKISKQYENTVIFFLSDGGMTEQQENKTIIETNNTFENMGNASSMLSLGNGWTSIKMGNGSNTSMENMTIKAPLIISSPLFKNKAGTIDKEIRNIMDIVPTILEMTDLTHPSESYFEDVLPLEGKSILKLTIQ